jgi:hypothetical protein
LDAAFRDLVQQTVACRVTNACAVPMTMA